MTATDVVRRARAAGLRVSLRSDGSIEMRPATLLRPEIADAVRAHRAEVVEELRREAGAGTTPAARCVICGRQSDVLKATDGRDICAACGEWRVDCSAFTVQHHADVAAERARGACIRCGATWVMHGRPALSSWNRIDQCEAVQLFEARFVVAVADAMLLRNDDRTA